MRLRRCRVHHDWRARAPMDPARRRARLRSVVAVGGVFVVISWQPPSRRCGEGRKRAGYVTGHDAKASTTLSASSMQALVCWGFQYYEDIWRTLGGWRDGDRVREGEIMGIPDQGLSPELHGMGKDLKN